VSRSSNTQAKMCAIRHFFSKIKKIQNYNSKLQYSKLHCFKLKSLKLQSLKLQSLKITKLENTKFKIGGDKDRIVKFKIILQILNFLRIHTNFVFKLYFELCHLELFTPTQNFLLAFIHFIYPLSMLNCKGIMLIYTIHRRQVSLRVVFLNTHI
jgi:hypothetical protein